MDNISELILETITFDTGEPELVQHFIKVHEFAKLIGVMENISPGDMEVLEAAAIVHDIGIKVCMQQYGECSGKLQEQVGPAYAEEILNKLKFRQDVTERVSYLVAHHHTYSHIDGADYQILVEADALVNFYEHQDSKEAIRRTYDNIFKTVSGKILCAQMFMNV